MAITALAVPANYTAAYNDINFILQSDSVVANPEMSLRLEIYLSDIYIIEKFIHYEITELGKVFNFNISNEIQRAIIDNAANLKNIGASGWFSGDSAARVDWKIVAYEWGEVSTNPTVYGNLGASYSSADFVSYNIVLDSDTNDISSYIMSTTNTANILSNADDTLEMKRTDQLQISLLSDNTYTTSIKIDNYDASNQLINSANYDYFVDASSIKKIFCITSVHINENASYIKYTIQQNNTGYVDVSNEKTVYIDCETDEKPRFTFLNNWGCFDFFSFDYETSKTLIQKNVIENQAINKSVITKYYNQRKAIFRGYKNSSGQSEITENIFLFLVQITFSLLVYRTNANYELIFVTDNNITDYDDKNNLQIFSINYSTKKKLSQNL